MKISSFHLSYNMNKIGGNSTLSGSTIVIHPLYRAKVSPVLTFSILKPLSIKNVNLRI
jgi:hypothetical protein